MSDEKYLSFSDRRSMSECKDLSIPSSWANITPIPPVFSFYWHGTVVLTLSCVEDKFSVKLGDGIDTDSAARIFLNMVAQQMGAPIPFPDEAPHPSRYRSFDWWTHSINDATGMPHARFLQLLPEECSFSVAQHVAGALGIELTQSMVDLDEDVAIDPDQSAAFVAELVSQNRAARDKGVDVPLLCAAAETDDGTLQIFWARPTASVFDLTEGGG